MVMLTSCKDEESFDYPGYSKNRIYIKNTIGILAFKAQKTPVSVLSDMTIKIPAFCTSPAISSLEANLAIDTSYVSKYNQINKTKYLSIPAEAFDLINSKLTIPAKSFVSKDSVEIKVKTAAFQNVNPGVYLIPLAITNTNNNDFAAVSSNRNILYFTLTVTEDLDNIWNITPSEKGILLATDRSAWTVTATNSSFNGPINQLFDNNLNNRLSYSINQLDHTTGFVVDMKQVYPNLNGIAMHFYYSYYSMTNVDVYTSVDNAQWIMQGNSVNQSEVWNLIFYKSISARYIKLIVREKPLYGIYFKEFNVFTK